MGRTLTANSATQKAAVSLSMVTLILVLVVRNIIPAKNVLVFQPLMANSTLLDFPTQQQQQGTNDPMQLADTRQGAPNIASPPSVLPSFAASNRFHATSPNETQTVDIIASPPVLLSTAKVRLHATTPNESQSASISVRPSRPSHATNTEGADSATHLGLRASEKNSLRMVTSNQTGRADIATLPPALRSSPARSSYHALPIFTCGFPLGKLRESLFPEFRHEVRISWKTRSHPNSLLFFGIWGPCPSIAGPSKLSHDWISKKWRGKTLYVNGESNWADVPLNGSSYGIGSIAQETPNSIGSTFVGLSFVAYYDADTWPLLFDHSRKPRSTQERFCIYATSNCVDFREDAADRLTAFGSVYQGGACMGTNGTMLFSTTKKEKRRKGDMSAKWAKNYEQFSMYSFCLVMENKYVPGYVTEKILNAFLGGCIPIYYGTADVFDIFNARAFVYYNITDPGPALAQIEYLQSNKTAYDEVMSGEPILANGEVTIEEYFSFSDEIGNGTLKRRIREKMGL